MNGGHGVIIGKFYPPHEGHHALIRMAAGQCESVSVVVMASFSETVSIRDRVAWLRTEHLGDPNVEVVGIRCDAPVDLTDDAVWTAQVACVRAAVRAKITSVWSGEEYGEELARRLGATHHRVARSDVSASVVRADTPGRWAQLAPSTRAGLALRVVVVGAESTGTTTVARAIADQFRSRGGVWTRTQLVEEYGREFTEVVWARQRAQADLMGRPRPRLDEVVWTADDFDEVAAEQTSRENAAAAQGSPLLVCDTDALATTVWERRYLGSEARVGQPWAVSPALPRHDLYLVTDHVGVPWVDDGLREGDLDVRAAMTSWFMEALTSGEQSWVLLSGSLEARLALALRTLDALLAHRFAFGPPLTGPGFGG